MCESTAFLINQNGDEEKIMEYVIDIFPEEDGQLTLTDLLGTTKTIQAKIKEVKLLKHKIILEEIPA